MVQDWQIVVERKCSTMLQASAVTLKMFLDGKLLKKAFCPFLTFHFSETYWIEKLKEEDSDEYYYDDY